MEDINIKHSVEFTNSSLENALSTLTDAISRFNDMGNKSTSTSQSDIAVLQEKSNLRMAEKAKSTAYKIREIQEDAAKKIKASKEDTANKIKVLQADGAKKVSVGQEDTANKIKLMQEDAAKKIRIAQEYSAAKIKVIEGDVLADKVKTANKVNLLNASTAEKLNLDSERHTKRLTTLRVQAQDKASQLELNSALRIKEFKEKEDYKRSNPKDPFANIAKGLVLGGVLSAAYMGNQFGSTAGKEAGSLNTSASNYLGFQQNLYNMQLQNQNNLVTALSGAAGGILGGLVGSIIPVVGTSMGASIGAIGGVGIGGYLSGQSTEEDKARYEFATNKEFQAWQLQQMGISGASKKGYLAGDKESTFGMTDLQDKANATGAYADTTLQFALHGRRDIVNRMSDDEIVAFGKKAQMSANKLGADPASFINAITQVAANTGKSSEDIRKQTMDNARKYGGDTVSNLAKIIQLMQTTPLGQKGAENLVNTYQYNDAMIKNKVNASTASPFGIFTAKMLMKAGGATEKEIQSVLSGSMPSRLKGVIAHGRHDAGGDLSADSIYAELLMRGAGAIGVNPFVNAGGAVKPSIRNPKAIDTAPEEPSTLKDMSTMVANQLQQIIVNGNVSLSGSIDFEQNKSKFINNFQDNLKMKELPHSGVSSAQGVH